MVLQWVEALRILQQVEAELDRIRLIPGMLPAVIPDLSRQSKVTLCMANYQSRGN